MKQPQAVADDIGRGGIPRRCDAAASLKLRKQGLCLQPGDHSAALRRRGLIEAGGIGGGADGRATYSAALRRRGLIEAAAGSSKMAIRLAIPRRCDAAASLKRHEYWRSIVLGAYSAALRRRGLNEALNCEGYPGMMRIPRRCDAAASLKRELPRLPPHSPPRFRGVATPRPH